MHTTGAKPQPLQLWIPARKSPSCGSVFLSRGLKEIIWIICRKRISHFAIQALAHGWSAPSFKRGPGMKAHMGSFSKETNLPALMALEYTSTLLRGAHEKHWKSEPKTLQRLWTKVCVRHASGEATEDTLSERGNNPEVKYMDRGWAARFPLYEVPLPLDSLGLLELSENNAFYFLLFSPWSLSSLSGTLLFCCYLHGRHVSPPF